MKTIAKKQVPNDTGTATVPDYDGSWPPEWAIKVISDANGYTCYEAGDTLPVDPVPTPDPNAPILIQIAALEATQTLRRIREALTDPTWMNNLNSQIAELRKQLK